MIYDACALYRAQASMCASTWSLRMVSRVSAKCTEKLSSVHGHLLGILWYVNNDGIDVCMQFNTGYGCECMLVFGL